MTNPSTAAAERSAHVTRGDHDPPPLAPWAAEAIQTGVARAGVWADLSIALGALVTIAGVPNSAAALVAQDALGRIGSER